MATALGPAPVLSLVVDRQAARTELRTAVEAAVRCGVDWVQLRERALEGAEWLAWADALAAAVRRGARSSGRQARVIVNRRVDIALAIAADGVHLGRGAMAPSEARALLGPERLIGVSTHGVEDVEAASECADYVHLAPIFAPLSKRPTAPPLGVEALAGASRHGLPVLGQGGIERDHCEAIVAAGAAGIAVTGAILMADDPGAAAASLRRALDRADRRGR